MMSLVGLQIDISVWALMALIGRMDCSERGTRLYPQVAEVAGALYLWTP